MKNPVLKLSILVCGLFILVGIIWTSWLASAANTLLSIALDYFDWFYLFAGSAFVGFCLFFMFSKYGKVKLGKDSDEPEHSTRSWIAMLFSGGMGVGLVFWSVAEPVTHYANPPYGEASSAESAALSMKYVFFHWGLHPWAIFALLGLGLAYFQYRIGLPATISSIFYPILGDKIYSPIGKTIDILAVFITAIGVASTLGLSALQITGGLNFSYSIPNTTTFQIIVIVTATVLFLISALSGLNRGIKVLSNINMVLAGVLMLTLFMIGPTKQILQVFLSSSSGYISDILNLSFRLNAFAPSGNQWIQDWTVFYWAWWMTWGPFVGSFFARISKGRTIKEYLAGVLIVPTLITFIWFAIVGVSAIHQVQSLGNNQLVEEINNNITYALFAFLNFYQIGPILSITSFIIILVFFITSADSATYVLSMLSYGGELNPSKKLKVLWGLIIAGSAVVFLLAGGLDAVKTVAIVVASPFTLLLVLMGFSILKSLQDEHRVPASLTKVHRVGYWKKDQAAEKISKDG
ncbi:glycine betaine transporter [Halobacillus karajensis]|uniref:BCCT family transporter n=1 Tax=Halobacillus karajensis TaxID=195088 RepID=UPI0008A7C17F|nr:BCCT family transporter [Halobacillus karajensis]SEI04049.1 glycine betaine transporter [Halobacillus karajensis]